MPGLVQPTTAICSVLVPGKPGNVRSGAVLSDEGASRKTLGLLMPPKLSPLCIATRATTTRSSPELTLCGPLIQNKRVRCVEHHVVRSAAVVCQSLASMRSSLARARRIEVKRFDTTNSCLNVLLPWRAWLAE